MSCNITSFFSELVQYKRRVRVSCSSASDPNIRLWIVVTLTVLISCQKPPTSQCPPGRRQGDIATRNSAIIVVLLLVFASHMQHALCKFFPTWYGGYHSLDIRNPIAIVAVVPLLDNIHISCFSTTRS
ncbi:hypothetical protein HRR83_006048 [Exophiala dermatitidis]|uniref:Uncharacterized protein n=1 Tax=Exophiala dermatitidis TaxID=5970 RepID=A0AAN6ERF2_EXODE|nr:hypothetical protein HRR74_005445 [Exophiala dermatitidis]KAJ4517471.1 hypothetical protein HRR73_004523 [Exophiala dermatitidis]KAJ4548776.1 hypothetical protein HRR76_001356 [Exophiala dermatitidis]KAJ4552506.1 hypothetical protein HRR77_002514 [Exophiala dermatitidis]KAJ4567014.1 hypothetical protein HRR81_007090 [Exophiala dermatitidis]